MKKTKYIVANIVNRERNKGEMKKTRKIIVGMLFLIFCLTQISQAQQTQETLITEKNYEETIEKIDNPDRGFYYPVSISCKPQGMNKDFKIPKANQLIHLRLGLKQFTQKGNGKQDFNLTVEMIDTLNEYLQQIRQSGGTAIIRFAYDDFEGIADLEPSMEQIEKHIQQLKPFFEQNEDVITCVETGFLGPWGEQHTSKIVTSENMKKIVKRMLEIVPSSRTINVRKPQWYCDYRNIAINQIEQNQTTENEEAYRVGIFNDGYLGSKSDLGTFRDRKKEIQWLNQQAKHTLYGGEVVKGTQDLDEKGNLYNSLEHIQKEMFETHTSYLNCLWNDQVIKKWKETIYTGEDLKYQGQSGYTYIENHLGYRFVLRKAKLQKEYEKNENFKVELQLENVGAGNVVNQKKTYLILKKENQLMAKELPIDVRKWDTQIQQNISIDLPIKDLESGDYEIYLKIMDAKKDPLQENKRGIQLANKEVWDKEIGANKIATVTIKETKQQITQEENKENHKTETNSNSVGNTEQAFVIEPQRQDNTNQTDLPLPNKLPYTGKQTSEFFPIVLISSMMIFLVLRYQKRNKT